jgi:hypothetical protein
MRLPRRIAFLSSLLLFALAYPSAFIGQSQPAAAADSATREEIENFLRTARITKSKLLPVGVTLPQTLSGAELKAVVSKPFNAGAGPLKVTYAYKGTATGTGTIKICDVSTGKFLTVNNMMHAGKASGEFSINIPAAGVYVAQTRFPLRSQGGDVTLSK